MFEYCLGFRNVQIGKGQMSCHVRENALIFSPFFENTRLEFVRMKGNIDACIDKQSRWTSYSVSTEDHSHLAA